MKADAKLIVDASERNAELYYATRFLAPDPLIYLEIKGKKVLVVSSLEYGRAKRTAQVDSVELSKKGLTLAQEVIDLLTRHACSQAAVQESLAYGLAKEIGEAGIILKPVSSLYPEREIKMNDEVRAIIEVQQATQEAMQKGIEALRSPGATSESVRGAIDTFLVASGYEPKGTIVSHGIGSADPHDAGSGRIRAGESVIIDIFPRSSATRYFADMTRTFVLGEPSEELKRMYKAVQGAQELVFSLLRPGVKGSDIQAAAEYFFKGEGFPQEVRGGMPQGFIHSVGHGVGLELHERPTISSRKDVLKEGNVLTVEPGLYYSHIGGIRLEDMMLITKDGYKNLTNFPKTFVL